MLPAARDDVRPGHEGVQIDLRSGALSQQFVVDHGGGGGVVECGVRGPAERKGENAEGREGDGGGR